MEVNGEAACNETADHYDGNAESAQPAFFRIRLEIDLGFVLLHGWVIKAHFGFQTPPTHLDAVCIIAGCV